MEQSVKLEMIQKITKLLNLSEEDKNENPHEREVAKRMAAKLMAEHAISFAEIESNGNGQKKITTLTEAKLNTLGKKYRKWEGLLGMYIAETWDSEIVLISSYRGEKIISFLGHKSDLDIITDFFVYLRRTVSAMERLYTGRSKADYTHGLVSTIGHRLKELYKIRQEVTPSECRDLIVVKKDAVAKFVKEKFPRLRMRRYNSRATSSLFDGMRDGNNVDLSRAAASRERREQIT